MKLIFCPNCEDVVKLHYNNRHCLCGDAWGYYRDDGLNAVIGGKAVPLGFDNSSLVTALKERPADGMGRRFVAFVIPEQCPTVVDEG